MKFNLNADMAEGYGPWKMGDDDGLLEVVKTANIACGFHGGDHNIMAQVMEKATKRGVSIGAHPSFLDLHGFGRRQMHLSGAEIERLMAYQIGASLGMAALVGAEITHVKPHGAISNMACADGDMAQAICRAIVAVDKELILLAPALSQLAEKGSAAGLPVAQEVFADRTYLNDGQLCPRSRKEALIEDPEEALQQCLSIFEEGKVRTLDGTWLSLPSQSICVHGDGASALALAKHVKQGMEQAGYENVALPEMMGA